MFDLLSEYVFKWLKMSLLFPSVDLKDLVKNGEAPEHNTHGSSTGLSGEDNSPRDTLRPKSEFVQTVLTPDGCRRTSEAEDV